VRGWGVAVVVACVCAIGAVNAGAETGAVFRVGAREPLAMVFVAPQAERAKVTFTALQDVLVPALDADTKVRLEPADAEIRTCEGRLACIVERARGASAGEPPALLLVVSVRATPGQPDLVSSMLIDGARTQEITRKARLAGRRRRDRGADRGRGPAARAARDRRGRRGARAARAGDGGELSACLRRAKALEDVR